MRLLANLLSILMHPLWMPTVMIWLCFGLDPYMSYGYSKDLLLLLFGMVFTMTALFPLVSVLLMRRSGLVSDLTMPHRQERVPAFIIALMYYGMCWFLVRRTTDNPITSGMFMGSFISLLLVMLITLRWKISAHMAGIGGLIGAVLAVVVIDERAAPLVLCLLFVLAGALGTARLIASDHTPAQVYTGALLGCACVYGCAAFGNALQ